MTAPEDTPFPFPSRDYEGHIELRRDDHSIGDLVVNHYEGEPTVDVHLTVSSGRGSSGSIYAQLTADEAQELAGALKVAAGKVPAEVAA